MRADGRLDRRKVAGKTRAETQRKLDELRARVAAGLVVEAASERLTVAEYLDQWLEAIEGSVRPRTWESYSQLVRLHLRPALGHPKLVALRPGHLQKLYAAKDVGRLPVSGWGTAKSLSPWISTAAQSKD